MPASAPLITPARFANTMNFTFVGTPTSNDFAWFSSGLRNVMESHGHRYVDDAASAKLILNFFPKGQPKPVRRNASAIFVCGVTEFPAPYTNHLKQGYPILLRSISNLVAGMVPNGEGDPDICFLTPEQGNYRVSGDLPRDRYFEEIFQRIRPLATSTLVIENFYEDDLPEALCSGDAHTESISRAGERLKGLNLLPAPFPIEEHLSPRDIRHLERLYGIGGLSYGNLSARYDADWFWMSASGVDKSNLSEIGRHILMVKGYDAERNGMIVGHPPGVKPNRVSVDAIEHWMIYQEHPSVGAIMHVHGWAEGVPSTEFNFPCGTRELGQAVADIVREAEDPSRCVVGLKNHGLTITGTSLDEIFDRVGDRIVQHVPMD